MHPEIRINFVRCRFVCAVFVTTALAAVAATTLTARAGVPSGTFSGCPHNVRPLPARPLSSYAPAVRKAVQQFVRTSFVHISRTPAKLVGARTTTAFLVTNWLPSGWIKSECGSRVWQRSVGVGVYFPAMDPAHNPVGHCNDCARIIFLTSRTLGGWTVWGDY
jgi:hypothetical protein